MRAPLIVITGPPGVGKSTVASILETRFDPSAVVAGDFFLDALRTGKIAPWEPTSHDQNTKVIGLTVRAAADYADAGWTTILEGILGPWFLPAIREAATGHDVHYFVLEAPLDVCLERVEMRGPEVTSEVVAKMHSEFRHSSIDASHRVDAHREPETIAADLFERVGRRTALL
jgi:cytidylate kinase